MATSTFDRRIELDTPEAVLKMLAIAEMEPPSEPFCEHPFSDEDRRRGEELLLCCLSHSRHE